MFGAATDEWIDIAFYVWHVEVAGRHYLIDCGPPTRASDLGSLDESCRLMHPRCGFREARSLSDALGAFGLVPADVEAVLITQPIVYHSGGLDEALSPRTHVHMAFDGVREFLLAPPGHPDPGLYFTHDGWTAVRRLAIEGRLHLHDAPAEVARGIEFRPTGGHHPGSAAVVIDRLGGRTAIVETAFVQDNVRLGTPIGLAEDVARSRAVVRRLVDEVGDVVAIHDPGNSQRFPVERT